MVKEINSFKMLKNSFNDNYSYLLIYKKGSPQSDCAYKNFIEAAKDKDYNFFTVDVNKVKDVHTQYGVKTAPILLGFNSNKQTMSIKGCNDKDYYEKLFMGELKNSVKVNDETKKFPSVKVYSTPSCPWCTRVKAYLSEIGVPYNDVDVSKDEAQARAMQSKSGQTGVPQLEISGTMVVGFDKPKINKLLGIAN